MSVALDSEPDRWTTPAGWGIWADLTPPELLASRRLSGLRRGLLLGLVALVVLVVLAYGFATIQSRRAATAVTAEQTRTTALQAQELQYGGVTQIQGSVAQVQSQLSQLLVGNVDFAALLGSVDAVRPEAITLTGEQVTISGGAAAAGGAGTSLDTSDTPQIGKISVTGTAPNLDQLAGYLTALQAVHGVTDIAPGSTGITDTGITFTVTMSVTDVLLKDPYAVSPSAAANASTTGTSTSGATSTVAP